MYRFLEMKIIKPFFFVVVIFPFGCGIRVLCSSTTKVIRRRDIGFKTGEAKDRTHVPWLASRVPLPLHHVDFYF